MVEQVKQPNVPRGWGTDRLTQHIENCRRNSFATFANKPIFSKLKQIDDCFFRVLDKAINPRPWFPFQFIHRTHSAYRVSCSLAMAGQTVEVNAMLRLTLESAAYGHYIGRNSERMSTWQNRHSNEASKQATRSEFQFGKIRDWIKSDSAKLGEAFERLYEQTIDFGTHPNERGFSSNTNLEQSGDGIELQVVYLQRDGLQLDYALKTTARVGVWCLSIFQLIYPEKWELLGIRQELEVLRVGL